MIGIILNDGFSNEGNSISYVYTKFLKIFDKYLLIPLDHNIISNINLCEGIIMQGGDNFLPVHKNIIKYLYEKDIPLLAICMSMQAMGEVFNGKLKPVINHKSKEKYVHYVNIKKGTLLYDIIKSEKIMVNSSHKEVLQFTDLNISAYCEFIEAIEDNNKRFFLGVQWHPEKMITYDINSILIFKYFKEVCDGVKRINKNN